MPRQGNVISVPQFVQEDTCTIDETIRERLLNVLDYIEEVERIGGRVALKVTDHKRPAYFEHQLLDLPGIRFGDSASDTPWLEIERLQPIDPPLPEAEILQTLSRVPTNPSKAPVLDEELLADMVSDPEAEHIDELASERIKLAWNEYLNNSYIPWRDRELPRRKAIQFYAQMFGLLRALESDSASDPIELIWGIGLASWRLQGSTIQYPLLLQGVELAIDNHTRSITVTPRESEPIVELSPFSAFNNAGTTVARKSILEYFETGLDRTLSPFDEASFIVALNSCISALDSSGFLWDKHQQDPPNVKPPHASERLMVSNTWVLFVRPKTSHFLLQDLERLREMAKEAEQLPAGPHALFKDPSTEPSVFTRIPFRGVSSPNPDPVSGREPEDLYFPKPYNQEQVQIIERLEQAPGVVAQGPPGTGKTHTIANIICHYLANGRSILVTSKGEQALRVLKDKLPDGIRPLAVSLLSSDREALKEMETAVDMILQRLQRIDRIAIQNEIEAGHQRVDALCAEVAAAEKEIADWARKQLTQITYNGNPVMPDKLARILVREKEIHSWLPGPVKWREEPFILDDDNVQHLRALRRKVGQRLHCYDWTLPETDSLPSLDAFVELHRALNRRGDLIQSANRDDLPIPKRDFSEKGMKLRRQLRKAFAMAREVLRHALSSDDRWLYNLYEISRQSVTSSEKDSVVEDMRKLFDDVKTMEQERGELLGHPVELPPDAIEDPDFIAAVGRLADGQPAFSTFGGLTKSAQKKWLRTVRLLGQPLKDSTDWEWARRQLSLTRTSHETISRWNAFMQEFEGPVMADSSTANCKKMALEAGRGQRVFYYCQTGMPFITRALSAVFNRDANRSDIPRSLDTIDLYITALDNHIGQGELEAAVALQADLCRILTKHDNSLSKKLLDLIESKLGNGGIGEKQLLQSYKQLTDELETLQELQPAFSDIRKLAIQIAQGGAEQWSKSLLEEPASPQTDRLLPQNWREGVNWHRFMNYLEGIDGQHRLQELAQNLRTSEKRLSQTQVRLVENITWLGMTGISEQYQRALRQYAIAVNRIGAGTGRVRTPRYRREAREAMKKAVGAIPCWIMPHWRISETLPADLGRFDLVIIDEASQSDIWALPALLRGKKILVVGDDKQVSPSVIGKSEATLVSLSNQYLKGFDLGKQMGPESSIYDLAQVAFAADNICLREHFRCAESIITFSDKNWYNCLVPLRVPLPNERIDPPLVDVYVKDGVRDVRKKTNLPEAHAIVKEIQALVEDSQFANRSIGVISMLGQGAQAKLIANLMFDIIGEKAISKHDILCGDPSSFQGNERDIIFLSMIDDAKHLRSRSDKGSQQRFNVAASRAKDRMYLFHSFHRDDVKNPNDLRGKLIDHFHRPLAQAHKQVASLRELCDSDFEERVFDALVAKGYRVIPQVPAGGFRIDLVVEGHENRRLAIECDGGRYHGPERYFDDLNRQRVLERAGWTFWRCWGSTFYREPERVLSGLFDTLAEMGIAPTGGDIEIQNGYVELREVYGFAESKALQQERSRVTEFEEKVVIPDLPNGHMETDTSEDRSIDSGESTEDHEIQDFRGEQLSLPIEEPSVTSAGAASPKPDMPEEEVICVEPNDSVSYCFLDNETEIKTVQIVNGPNQPDMGIININAPLARALLGSEIDEVVQVHLPTGLKKARVVAVEKASESS
jgi:transcription elongation GreA/GreB family factor/very-short-patch-repair endonuclease